MTKQACCEYVEKYIPKDVANIVIDYAYDQWLRVHTDGRYTYTDGQRVIAKKYVPYDVYDKTIYFCNGCVITCTDLDFNILNVIKLNRLVLGIICTKNIIFIETMNHIEKYDLITSSITARIMTNARLALIYENKLICRHLKYVYIYSLNLKFIKQFECPSYIRYICITDNRLIAVLDNWEEELIVISDCMY